MLHAPSGRGGRDGAYCDADPLGTGRRMLLRWGKNVKMTVKFGTGGVPTNLRKKARDGEEERRGTVASGQRDGSDRATVDASDNVRPPAPTFNRDEGQTSVAIPPSIGASVSTVVEERRVAPPKGPTYDPAKHSAEAITVIAPTDPRRLKFITTVASFVAKDGSVLVQKLIETQSFNLDFRFLTPRDDDDDAVHPFSSDNDDDDVRFEEHVFYRWRGYSFAQGDGFSSWRTDPFVMFELHGRFWIPPPAEYPRRAGGGRGRETLGEYDTGRAGGKEKARR